MDHYDIVPQLVADKILPTQAARGGRGRITVASSGEKPRGSIAGPTEVDPKVAPTSRSAVRDVLVRARRSPSKGTLMAQEDMSAHPTAPCSHVTAKSSFAIAAPSSLGKRSRPLLHHLHLADSLPRSVLAKIVERHHILATAKQTMPIFFPSRKPCSPTIATRALKSTSTAAPARAHSSTCASPVPWPRPSLREGTHYRLLAWCVMPTTFTLWQDFSQARSLRRISKPGRTFQQKPPTRRSDARRFWQREYYDRLIRNGDELDRAIRTSSKTRQAGLKDWTWFGARLGSPRHSGQEAGATSSLAPQRIPSNAERPVEESKNNDRITLAK